MAKLNVTQPDGGNAIFNTVTDEFIEFHAGVREFAETMAWDVAMRHAIGAGMAITSCVQTAIELRLVSREQCQKTLQDLEVDFEA